jgi:hypothetical protein
MFQLLEFLPCNPYRDYVQRLAGAHAVTPQQPFNPSSVARRQRDRQPVVRGD